VHPLHEYCSSAWNPRYHCDADDKVESVQRRFTKKNIGTLINLSYPDVHVLLAESLELRRLKFDLIMMSRIIHGYCALD